MYKFFHKLHLWLSVPCGVIIFVTCLTGAMLILPLPDSIGTFAFRMHRWLMDVPEARGAITPGKIIVGVSTLCMVLILISGIVLWWPRAKSHFGQSLSIRCRSGWHHFWQSLHVAGGMYVVLFLLIMALTGLTWSFGWYREGFYTIFGGSDPEALRPIVRGLHTGAIGGTVTRIIWCTAAIVGATLPMTGYYLWLKPRKKHRSHKF